MNAPRCYALVPCAGIGARAGGDAPKQYRGVAGRPMVAWTLDALHAVARIEATLVVLAPDDDAFERHLPRFAGWVARCGGVSRAASVANGLAELSRRGVEPRDWVLVHDAARCLIDGDTIDRLIDACIDDDIGGLLALPVGDTLKQAPGGERRVAATISRADKWLAQTPQMFRLGLLRDALARAAVEPTDEAAAIEALGLAPKLVNGSARNIKLTWPGDFEIAEALLRAR